MMTSLESSGLRAKFMRFLSHVNRGARQAMEPQRPRLSPSACALLEVAPKAVSGLPELAWTEVDEALPQRRAPAANMALCPLTERLRGRRLVLASGSPRRRDILSYTGLTFDVIPSTFAETLDKATFSSPPDYAVETAKQKALEVAERMGKADRLTPVVVIGADTVMALDGQILEKPQDKEDAVRMLRRLSGRTHSVFTGVAVVSLPSSCDTKATVPRCDLEAEVRTFHTETRVTFSELTEELVQEYAAGGEPMDKAGAYGIQAGGAMFVEHMDGDFLSVVGFPLNRFCREVAAMFPEVATHPGVNGADPARRCH